ncbi:MAG: histidine kinase [Bacteroidia bacterium]|nr:histidine kinase [Bacteroidia bacterium]
MQISPLTHVLNFILRYKLLHIGFWAYHAISFFHVLRERFGEHPLNYIETGIIIGIQMVLIYSVLLILIPRTIEKRKYFAFILGVLLSISICIAVRIFLQDLATLYYLGRHIHSYNLIPKFISGFVDDVVLLSLFIGIYSLRDKYYAERNKALKEKENLNAELEFLKSQLNPHFLFNAINNIYFLIRQDRELAERTLLEFSGLLRYQLYECGSDQTFLEKELNFIQAYTQLEKIRNDKSLELEVQFPQVDGNLKIAPFILITFVENAFKHKSEAVGKHFIHISAEVKDTFLIFQVSNSNAGTTTSAEPGGIGLRNVKRRLELLYPGRHRLIIKNDENVFSVNLELNLQQT